MKTPRITLAAFFLASAIWAQAATITLTGNLSQFSHQSSDPGQFAGLSPTAAGDPYSLKLVFNDALLVVPGAGADSNMLNALSLFELSVNGEVLATMSNLKLQFLNNVGGRDSIYIQQNGSLSVTGMNPVTSLGYVSMQIHDSSQTAFQYGQPVDFAKFFDNTVDAFGMGVGIYQNNPYSGNFSQLNINANTDPTLYTPQIQSVPDASATLSLLAVGLAGLAVLRRHNARDTGKDI